jgi:hypothetical protein
LVSPASSYGQGEALDRKKNIQAEDAVAALFHHEREKAKLPPLKRIKDRRSLQQLVCTAAVTGKTPLYPNGFPMLADLQDEPSDLYKTTNPSEVTAELQRIALFERPRKNGHSPGYSRYSVAVWPDREPIEGQPAYWVGIELFWSSSSEIFLNHFTDQREWKNEWERAVTEECQHVD